jgi:hypothetical protein
MLILSIRINSYNHHSFHSHILSEYHSTASRRRRICNRIVLRFISRNCHRNRYPNPNAGTAHGSPLQLREVAVIRPVLNVHTLAGRTARPGTRPRNAAARRIWSARRHVARHHPRYGAVTGLVPRNGASPRSEQSGVINVLGHQAERVIWCGGAHSPLDAFLRNFGARSRQVGAATARVIPARYVRRDFDRCAWQRSKAPGHILHKCGAWFTHPYLFNICI